MEDNNLTGSQRDVLLNKSTSTANTNSILETQEVIQLKMNCDQSEDLMTVHEIQIAENINPKILVRQTSLRWLMLFFATIFMMGSYYCYDNPAPLKSKLTSDPFDLTETQFNALYTIYALPNIVLPVFGGIFMDKIGFRFGLILFTSILTVG